VPYVIVATVAFAVGFIVGFIACWIRKSWVEDKLRRDREALKSAAQGVLNKL
jgi:hypothetical protein